MNLYIIDGHVSRSGERGWLRTDQFLKVPKTQNRWYNLHPAPNPGDTRPGKVVKFWSSDAPHLNHSFSRIAKPSGLTVTPPPSRPVAQDTLRSGTRPYVKEHMFATRLQGLIVASLNCRLTSWRILGPLSQSLLKENPPRRLKRL